MKTTEVNKRIIGRRCKCIFTGLLVTGIIEGFVPAEKTSMFLSNDCKKPCAIWLRQLLPVQRIKIFIFL